MDPAHRMRMTKLLVYDPYLLELWQIGAHCNGAPTAFLYFVRPQNLERVFVIAMNDGGNLLDINLRSHGRSSFYSSVLIEMGIDIVPDGKFRWLNAVF